MAEKAQGWGRLVRPFRVTQAFVFQTAAFNSIFEEKQNTTSADVFYGNSQFKAVTMKISPQCKTQE